MRRAKLGAILGLTLLTWVGSALMATDLTPEQISAEVTAAMDSEADPCADFYQYACGGWLETTERPADQARWARSFSVIREDNRAFVRDVLEDAAQDPGEDPDRVKIGTFYGACMDQEAIDARGTEPLQKVFGLIDAAEGPADFLKLTAMAQRHGVAPFFDVAVFPDFQNPDLNISWMFQGGLGMPDRDYYVSEDSNKQELLAEYQKHVARMLALAGIENQTAEENAATVLAIETRLAQASRPAEEMRIMERLYNKVDRSGLEDLTPSLAWGDYFETTGYGDLVDISVATPEFFEAIQQLFEDTSAADIKTYLKWQAVNGLSTRLSTELVEASFDFFGKKLAGVVEIRPRWKRCVAATEAALGEIIGRVYIKERFAGNSKDVALTMIADIEQAFENGLPGLSWMDDETRERAIEKVATLQDKIGFPDEWRDYSALTVTADDYFANAGNAAEFEYDYEAKKVGNPVNRKEWGMTPQMVNAYYNPLWNEIAFPAGILQPPFFHKDFPAAMNYGGIGSVIGHELTHGFDDQGRKFGPDGKFSEWWAAEAIEAFQEQAQCVADHYSEYEVAEGASVNGNLTLGENIADIGGVKEGYAAYKLYEARQEGLQPAVEGMTNDQLFFVSQAQVWCQLASEEMERMQVTTDPHSPAKFRVLGPLTNNAVFAEAFQCAEGTAMNPEQRCEVW